MRYAIVTETYPPEVNGVALTVHALETGLRARGHIRAWVAPLDEFSFPSGHTLHAVAFSLVAVAHVPLLAWLLLPFTACVAVSRVVLGLHYPSDVLAATVIGSALAGLSLWVVSPWLPLGLPLA